MKKIGYLVDHAAVLRSIFNFNLLVQTTQAETSHTGLMLATTADGTFDQRYLKCLFFRLCHEFISSLLSL